MTVDDIGTNKWMSTTTLGFNQPVRLTSLASWVVLLVNKHRRPAHVTQCPT